MSERIAPTDARGCPRFDESEPGKGNALPVTDGDSSTSGRRRRKRDHAMLTAEEVAELLRVNVKTVYSEIRAGRLAAVKLGRVIRIPRAVVASIVEQGRVAPPGGQHGGSAR